MGYHFYPIMTSRFPFHTSFTAALLFAAAGAVAADAPVSAPGASAPVQAKIPSPQFQSDYFGEMARAFCVILEVDAKARALVVKRDAVVFVDGKPTVFRAESPTRVVPVPVRLGNSNESDMEILEGITEKDTVVTSGAFYLKSELFR